MNRFVKIKGHSNWFLVFDAKTNIEESFEKSNREKMASLIMNRYLDINTDFKSVDPENLRRRLEILDRPIDYTVLSEKYGTLLIRPIGTYMLLAGTEVIEERFDSSFPVIDTADIVICENDAVSEKHWNEYLKNRFPDKSITTINFFRMRSDEEVRKYFEKAKYITFSTTFSDLDWYKKLVRNLTPEHKVIGFSHASWEKALEIYNKVEQCEKYYEIN